MGDEHLEGGHNRLFRKSGTVRGRGQNEVVDLRVLYPDSSAFMHHTAFDSLWSFTGSILLSAFLLLAFRTCHPSQHQVLLHDNA